MAAKKTPKAAEEPGSRWETAKTVLGIVSAVLGIVLAGFKAAEAWQQHRDAAATRASATAADAPRLTVQYASLSTELFSMLRQRRTADTAGAAFLAFPVLRTEVASDTSWSDWSPPPSDTTEYETRLTFLVIQNLGKEDAADLRVVLDRLALANPVDVRESVGGSGSAYERALRGGASGEREVSFDVPDPLRTGAGLLVPLFSTRQPWMQARGERRWLVPPPALYLPKFLEFTDARGERHRVPVRRMRDPVRFDNGVEARG